MFGSIRRTATSLTALATVTVALLLMGLAACSGESAPAGGGSDATSSASAQFPVTVKHKFGSTTVPTKPVRIVTLGYTDQDAVLAVGVRPTASVSWFEDKVVYPWSAAAATAVGGSDKIKIISAEKLESGGPEAIAAYRPDLIISVFSYITKDQYKEYSKIAPTVVGLAKFPNDGTPWQDATLLIGRALGREQAAETAVAKATATIKGIAAANPEFAGKTAFASGGLGDGQVALYPTGRSGSAYTGGSYAAGYLLPALGFEIPAMFDKLGDKVTTPLLSYEMIKDLDLDLGLLAFTKDSETGVELNKIPTYQQLNLVSQGREVYTSDQVATALNFSTVLSLPWAAQQLEPQLAAAVDGDPATLATAAAGSP